MRDDTGNENCSELRVLLGSITEEVAPSCVFDDVTVLSKESPDTDPRLDSVLDANDNVDRELETRDSRVEDTIIEDCSEPRALLLMIIEEVAPSSVVSVVAILSEEGSRLDPILVCVNEAKAEVERSTVTSVDDGAVRVNSDPVAMLLTVAKVVVSSPVLCVVVILNDEPEVSESVPMLDSTGEVTLV